MHFKLIIVMCEDEKTRAVLDAARDAGAKGATVLHQARGEGLTGNKTFLGLSIDSQVNVLLMLVEEHFSRGILEKVAEVGNFDEQPGTGIAMQIDVEDAIGVQHQMQALSRDVKELI